MTVWAWGQAGSNKDCKARVAWVGGLGRDAGSGSRRRSRETRAHVKPPRTAARRRPHCGQGPPVATVSAKDARGGFSYAAAPAPQPVTASGVKRPTPWPGWDSCSEGLSPALPRPSSGLGGLGRRPRFAPLLPPSPVAHSPLGFPEKPAINHVHRNPGSSPGLAPAVRWRWGLFPSSLRRGGRCLPGPRRRSTAAGAGEHPGT